MGVTIRGYHHAADSMCTAMKQSTFGDPRVLLDRDLATWSWQCVQQCTLQLLAVSFTDPWLQDCSPGRWQYFYSSKRV